MVRSPKLSFRGYSFSMALYRNKDAIKAIVALLGGVNVVMGFDWKTFLISVGGGFLTLAVKLLSDAVDFYFSDVEL